ncbi:MAG: hypothetical protein COB37_02835 [Kordiimonadales bacterium]|nr:MAG: hypothetical protein COB37_02835 [Kordiimonadales bacterium]
MLKQALIAAILSAAPVGASPLYAQPEMILPSKLCGVYFMMPLTVKGVGGKDHTLQFLLDTGSFGSFVDPDALARTTGKTRKYGNRTRLTGVSLGSHRLGQLKISVAELDSIEVALGTQMDGILGFSVFEDHLLTIDYPKKEVRVASGRLPRPNGRDIFSARGRDPRPWLNVWLGDRRLKLLIDSAAGGAMSVRNLNGIEVAAPPVVASTGQHIDHIAINRITRAQHDLVIGRHRVERPMLSVIPETPLLTAHIMWNFSFTFDQKTQRVRISSPTNVPVRVPSQSGSGILLSAEDGDMKVIGVVAGSPAEAAGLKAGDQVVAIDNKPPAQRGCEKHSIPEGSVLTFRRDKTVFSRKLSRNLVVK